MDTSQRLTYRPLVIKKEYFLIMFVIFPFFSDQIQGFLTLELNTFQFYSIIVKTGMMAIMIGYLVLKGKIQSLVTILFLCFILLASLLTDVDNLGFFVADIRMIFKLIFFPISYCFFRAIFEEYKMPDERIYSIYKFLFYALFVALVASIFGFGFSQYGTTSSGISVGYSGYFFAGNEMAPLAITLYSYCLFYNLYYEASLKRLSVVFFIGALTCFLTMTKVSLGGFMIATILIPVFMGLFSDLLRIKVVTYKYFSNLMIVGAIVITAIVIVFFDMIVAFYSRLGMIIERSGNILGARQDWVAIGWDIWLNKYTLLQQLIGGGAYYQTLVIEGELKSMEVDPVDLLLSNGILGTLAIYGFWAFVTLKLLITGYKTKDKYFGLVLFIILFTLATSFTSGHVMGSSIVGFYVAFLAGHSLMYSRAKYEL